MLALQARAFDRGIHLYHSNYLGAGPDGVLRCALFSDHSREDIDALMDALT
jgi:8-amino-7-oxononanoate synthase